MNCKMLLIPFLMLFSQVALAQEDSYNVVVVLDDSGSMGDGTKLADAKAGLITVLKQVPANSNVGICLLNHGWLTEIGPVNQAEIEIKINAIQARGGTPLAKNMKKGADALLEYRKQHHYGIYRLLIVTDGEANSGDADNVEPYLKDILSRGITVDAIGVAMKSDHSIARLLGDNYRRANDQASLEKAISASFAETSSEDSTNPDGETDFELLANIPIEIATECLIALAATGNHPIGTAPVAVIQIAQIVAEEQQAAPEDQPEGVPEEAHEAQDLSHNAATTSAVQTERSSATGIGGLFCACICPLFFGAVVLLFVAVKIMRKK
ncbi:MAG: hypothetical protein COA78_30540 [Blastopirellula sp.]|nr:MAG: hypothetical protein COA78_30540 [Blastopirellula sp.]